MKKSPFLLCLTAALVSALPASAEPKNITTVSMEQVAQLETMHQQATDLLIKNDFQGAIRAYSDILLTEPDDATAYTGLGQIYLVQGQVKKAHEAFQNALDIDPYNEVALQGLQRIMDPDGVDGMVHRAQAEGLSEEPSYSGKRTKLEPAKAAPSVPAAVMAKKTRKFVQKNFRPGFLNAQRMQMCLKNAGVYHGPVNGIMGDRTRQAVLKFQILRGLEPTGIINNDTRRGLLPYLNFNR